MNSVRSSVRTTKAARGEKRVPGSLLRARELIRPALHESLGRLSAELRKVMAYHLGFTDRDGGPGTGDGGKAVRPALAFLSAEAVGAPTEVALPGAVAVELVHNFSLLHDDVMDHDRERRHRPTAWALFGIGRAIVAGDALLVLANEWLLDPPSPQRERAALALDRATAQMIAGQADDLSFESRLDVTLEECLRMSAQKTGALLSCASSIGAILAGADERAVRALAGFGLHLGLAYQAIDDVLGIWGFPEVTGKPVASDLRSHKKTLPVVAALAVPGPRRDRLVDFLSNGHLPQQELLEATLLVEESGGRDRCMAEAEGQLALAMDSLDEAPLDTGARAELEELAGFVTARDF